MNVAMSQPAGSSPSFSSRISRPIAAKPAGSVGASASNSPSTPHTMASTGTITTSHGASTGANVVTPSSADNQTARPQFTFQFSAATEMILKRLRGEGGPLNPSSPLGMRSGASMGAVQPPGYEDVRRSVLQGMKTTLTMDIPPVTVKKNPKVVAARTATPTSLDASASPASGSGAGKGKAAAKVGRAKAGTKRKRAKDDSDSADDSANMSGLGGDSDSDGNGSVTNMPKQTLSGRKVVKPTQFNPAAVEGPSRKRGPYQYKRTGRSAEQALCKRCGRGHSPSSNMIVFCDGCNAGWHQMCHDPMVSDDLVKDESKEWFCNDCAAKRAKAATPPAPEAGKDLPWLAKGLEDKRAYLSTFSHSHLVSLLLQATIMHPDIPIFPASNPSPQSAQQNAPQNAKRNVNVHPQQPFPASTSTAGLFPRAEANPNAPINFIRKIKPGSSASPSSFITSFDHNPKPDTASNPSLKTSSAPPALSLSHPNQPGQDEDAEGEDESRASTPASPPYPRPGNGLMAKLPPDDQDLEWLVGEGEDDAAFSHVVFDTEGDTQKVDERGMTIAGHA